MDENPDVLIFYAYRYSNELGKAAEVVLEGKATTREIDRLYRLLNRDRGRHLSSDVYMGLIDLVRRATDEALFDVGLRSAKEMATLTLSASSDSMPRSSLEEIEGKNFEDADVALDGHAFKNCAFINCCLVYDGGPYRLENVTLKKHWHVCVRKTDLSNLGPLKAGRRPDRSGKLSTAVYGHFTPPPAGWLAPIHRGSLSGPRDLDSP